MAYAQKPLTTLQREAYARYANEKKAYDEAVQAKKDKKNKESLPDPPVPELLYTTDSTVEGIAEALKNSTGILNARDELSGFMASMDAYRKGGDRDTWLTAWNGYDLHVNRKTSGTTYIPDPAISIFGGIQPDRVSNLTDSKGKLDGFVDRWLLVRPDTKSRRWNEETVDPTTIIRMTNVFRRLRYPVGFEGSVALPLSDEARTVFGDWYDENAALVESSSGLAAGFYAKYPNQLARLILILHALANPDDLTGPIQAKTARDGITLIEYFRASLVRVLPMFNANASKESVGIRPRVLRLLEQAGGDWVDRTAINKGLGGYVKSEDITIALESLRGEGVAEPHSVSPGPSGGRPKEQWRFVHITDTPPEKPKEPQNARNDEASEPFRRSEKPRKNSGATPDPGRNPSPFGSPRGSTKPFSPLSRND